MHQLRTWVNPDKVYGTKVLGFKRRSQWKRVLGHGFLPLRLSPSDAERVVKPSSYRGASIDGHRHFLALP